VTLPKGHAHLPADAVDADALAAPSDGRSSIAAYAAEAARWERRSSGAAAASHAAADGTAPGPRARVLVVDDNPDLRTYIAGLLAPSYDVTTAVDGQEALDVVREADPVPDLVVSDVMMPRLDGVELVRALRAESRTASLPVILLSARAGEESTIVGLDAGSDDYLAKPFSARELLARVRTHVELARARRTWIAELERINRDLDAFSASVSHDLRAPLRAIEGFSRLLGEDYAGVLDERGHGYVDRIGANVRTMSTLIDDLLTMAKITRATLAAEPIDLSGLAEAVVGDLRRAEPERTVAITIAPDLRAVGDRRLVHIALVNLIGNAWKYTGKVAEPRIEVGRLAAEPATFFVRDNGAGFDMRYAKRLFEPFQRLHPAAEFEGTGVGLATVERIVARHGGRVWAEATVGEGAVFYFTLAT
jgi:signal transduction histidine kinase